MRNKNLILNFFTTTTLIVTINIAKADEWYNNLGQLERTGSSTSYYFYEYDDKGNRIRSTRYQDGIAVDQIILEYDKWDNKVSEINYSGWGSVAHKNITSKSIYENEYDANHNLISSTRYF